MEIAFNTKEESKELQEQAFLALAPSERVNMFLTKLQEEPLIPAKKQDKSDESFVIQIINKH